MSSSAAEQAAFAHFRAGRLAEAEAAYRGVVAAEPSNPQALHLLGFILATTGRVEEGLVLLGRSLELAPRNASFLDNRAQVLLQASRPADARRDLEAAVRLDPAALPAWLHLAQVLRRLEMREASRAAIGKALALDPGHVAARYHEGLLNLEAGDNAAAEASFRRVLQGEPRNVAALNNLGVVLRETGRRDEALVQFQRAAATDPANAFALNNLGLALHQRGELRDAQRLFKRAVELKPGFAQALLNWGNLLRDQGELEAASQRYAQALATEPPLAEALSAAASVALERTRLEEARSLYARALEVRPGFADPRFGLGQIALREGRFAEGWDLYESRFATDPPQARSRAPDLPPLDGAGLAQVRRLAVWSEQGIGDQVLFSTLLPELARRGVAAVVEIDERLLAMYRRSLPGLAFTSRDDAQAAFADCDRQVALGSLPRLFRHDLDSFAAQPAALLSADPARVEAARAQLGSVRPVAISWSSPQKLNRQALGARKSIPLEQFARLAAPGMALLDVQYGDLAAERAAFEAAHPGVLRRLPGLDAFTDLEGLAAALVACGRLVTTSNATAHLAGALGVPTILTYLEGWPPFAYWMPTSSGRSLWYPSVEIVTDRGWTRWEEAFGAIAARLEAGG